MRKLDIAKKQHRERGQLVHRQRKYGLLEKHSDYKKRAADYHSKEDRIKMMQRKSALRNKDEFYFGMVNSETSHGVHRQSRGNPVLTNGEAKRLKAEDAVYLRSQELHERQKIDKLEKELQLLQDGAGASTSTERPRKIVFVDGDDDVKRLKANKASRKKVEMTPELEAEIARLNEELAVRRERQSIMKEQLDAVELQRNLMTTKARRIKVRDGGEDRDGNPVLPRYKFVK